MSVLFSLFVRDNSLNIKIKFVEYNIKRKTCFSDLVFRLSLKYYMNLFKSERKEDSKSSIIHRESVTFLFLVINYNISRVPLSSLFKYIERSRIQNTLLIFLF